MAELQPWTNMAVTGASSGAVYMQGTGLGVQPCFIALQTLQTQFEECCSQLATGTTLPSNPKAWQTLLWRQLKCLCDSHLPLQKLACLSLPTDLIKPRILFQVLLTQVKVNALQGSVVAESVQVS